MVFPLIKEVICIGAGWFTFIDCLYFGVIKRRGTLQVYCRTEHDVLTGTHPKTLITRAEQSPF